MRLFAAALAWGAAVSSATSLAPAVPVVWTDALALGVGGRPFDNDGNFTYARFPPAAQPDLNGGEWSWSLCSTGMFVQFHTDATAVHVKYTLRSANKTVFSNFSPIGMSGVDLYARTAPTAPWRWVASAFNGLAGGAEVVESPLYANASGWPTPPAPPAPTQATPTFYRLHFPSYNGVLSLAVGVPQGAALSPDLSWNATRAAMYLGTSITQGGLTARPGQIYTNRLTRALDTVVKNMGFCGSCHLELGLAKWIAASGVPSTLVVDCTANMSPESVQANTAPFVRALRAAGGGWATVPIVLVEPITYMPAWLLGDVLQREGLRTQLRAAYDSLVAGGDAHLTYVPTATLEAQMDANEQLTYEGVHPLDRGHELIAAALAPILAPLVARGQSASPAVTTSAAALRAPLQQAPAPAPLPLLLDGELRSTDPPPGTTWVDATALTINRPFADSPSPYNRLPAAAATAVRSAVWELSLDSAGITVSFSTDSPYLAVDMTCRNSFEPMPHFPVTGVSGLDMWAWDDASGRYRFVVPGNNLFGEKRLYALLTPPGVNVTSVGGKRLRWLAVLPTYNEVTRLAFGVAPGAQVSGDAPFAAGAPARSPIVWYGTSILQGGVSFKSGEIESWRVSRALNRQVWNFGFSGNGKMETSVGQFLATVPSPAAFIIDCSWNVRGLGAGARAPPYSFPRPPHPHPLPPRPLPPFPPHPRRWTRPPSLLLQCPLSSSCAPAT